MVEISMVISQYLLQHPVRGAGFGEKLVVLRDKTVCVKLLLFEILF